jgi:hypothetical protein
LIDRAQYQALDENQRAHQRRMFRRSDHQSGFDGKKKVERIEGRAGAEIDQYIVRTQRLDQPQQQKLLVVADVCHERHAAVTGNETKIGYLRLDYQISWRTLHCSAQILANAGIAIL